MDPSLQHHYLQALGIVQYVPRDTVYEDVEASGDIETRPENAATQPEPATSGAAAKSVDVAALVNLDLDAKPSAQVSKATPKKAPKQAPKISPKEDSQLASNIEVKLSLWQVTESLLVCTLVEGELANQTEMELLTNILNAIGCGIKQLPQMDLLEWPPYPNAVGDEAEVREFLTMSLEARVAKSPIKSVLLLGDGAANWLASEYAGQQSDSGELTLSANTSGLLIPSLGEMIAQPQLKAVAWQRLQRLLPKAS